jgi:hypothetical protein
MNQSFYHEPELSIRSFVEGDDLKHPQCISFANFISQVLRVLAERYSRIPIV